MDTDLTVACIGDSALWCTGTRYEDKTPNRVHEALTGRPMPPAQFRARGGAIIGVDYPFRAQRLTADATGDPLAQEPARGMHVKSEEDIDAQVEDCRDAVAAGGFENADTCSISFNDHVVYQLNADGKYLADGDYDGFLHPDDEWEDAYTPDDPRDIDQLPWTVARDIGWSWPRVVDQIEHFPRRGEEPPELDVPEGTIDQLGGEPADPEPPFAEEVDLLLVNGGTNDIELGWLNHPFTGRATLRKATRKHCYEDQKELLARALAHFPNAVVALVGYFPFASDWTDREKAKEFLSSRAPGIGRLGTVVEQATDNALNFARAQSYWMRRAAAEVAREEGRVVFVSRGFGVVNAFDAPEPWCWSVPAAETDDTGPWRVPACVLKNDPPGVACTAASIGHPNRTGSRRTADAVVERYRGYARTSVGDALDELDGGRRTGLRRTLEDRDLDPSGDGVRYSLTHRLVDSIRVTVETGTGLGLRNAGAGGSGGLGTGVGGGFGPHYDDPKNDVYLKVAPGRSGSGERWRLESEYDDFRAGSTDRFYIDPMMGRKISNEAGPVPESHGMDEGTWQYQRKLKGKDHDEIPYPSGNDWDTDRLRLGDVEAVSFVIEDTDPWALERVTVEVNGHLEWTVEIDYGTEPGVAHDDRYGPVSPDTNGVVGTHEIPVWSLPGR